MAFIIAAICYSGTERHKRPSQFFLIFSFHFGFFSGNLFILLCILCMQHTVDANKKIYKNYDSLLWSLLEDKKIFLKDYYWGKNHKKKFSYCLCYIRAIFNGCKYHKYSLKWHKNIKLEVLRGCFGLSFEWEFT